MKKETSYKELLVAGGHLVQRSGLACWDLRQKHFIAVNRPTFVDFHNRLGPLGRLICWILFSVGAENIAKAACVKHGIVKVTEGVEKGICYPPKDRSIPEWAASVVDGRPFDETVTKYDCGTLDDYLKKYFKQLKAKAGLGVEDCNLLFAGYKLLKTLRNRDIHTYIKDVRENDFSLVEPVFVPCLNILLSTFESRSIKELETSLRNSPASPCQQFHDPDGLAGHPVNLYAIPLICYSVG